MGNFHIRICKQEAFALILSFWVLELKKSKYYYETKRNIFELGFMLIVGHTLEFSS
jgi:hypothetical protein